jgi:Asp-tRNA(Asn)/Glu-tRNA(Gln) amidotransferase A subunit family amidase
MTSTTKDRELAFAPSYKLVEMMKSKKLSPVELMECILRRIKELNPKLNAYLTVAEEEAMLGAKQAEAAISQGQNLGPIHGLPVAIKDLYLTKGIRTTSGSLVYKDFVPSKDGLLAERLKAAGAIIIGKTNTPEFGCANSTENRLGDACRNPWNLERTSGGSSGGTASAVAAGIIPLSPGSDGGGSVRIPACLCGLYGLKPTNGRIPYDPDAETGAVLDCACHGPITRTVRDAAFLMNVLSSPDRRDYSCLRSAPPDFVAGLNTKLKKLRIAWSSDLDYAEVDPEVKLATEKAAHVFEELGHSVEAATPALSAPYDTWDIIIASQYDFLIGSLFEKHAGEFMPYIKLCLELGRTIRSREVAAAWIEVGRWRGAMVDFLGKYDLLLTPTTAFPAFPIGAKSKLLGRGLINWGFTPFTPIFNLTYNPAATVPCGYSSDGLPIGLQIVGRIGEDAKVLKASADFEKARPWADKRPAIS